MIYVKVVSKYNLFNSSVFWATFLLLMSVFFDFIPGHGFHPDPMNYSYYGQPEHDTELSDSATSFNKGRMDEILSDVVNQIPRALETLLTFGTELTRSKLNHMKDILLNSELVLRIATDRREDPGPKNRGIK